MNVVDSSGWLENFADGPNADLFADPILEAGTLVVPVVTVFEVFKRMYLQLDEHAALSAVANMQQGQLVELDTALAVHAARLSVDLKLPMADSIILATARAHDAILWTQDSDYEGIENVNYRRRNS